MDDAIGGGDVGLDDVGVVDAYAAIGVDLELAALERLGAVELHGVGSGDVARYDVVLEDGPELLLILQQGRDRSFGELGEGLIGGREDGERSFALKCFDQSGRLDGGYQGVEAAGAGGCIDDVVRWQQNGVDHVDDSIAGAEVSVDDLGVIDADAFGRVDTEEGALQGSCRVQIGDVLRGDVAADDVVGQDLGKLLFVFEQGLDRSLWQLGKCFVGGSEDGERSLTFQSLNEAGCFDGCDEGVEVVGTCCDVDNIFLDGSECSAFLGALVLVFGDLSGGVLVVGGLAASSLGVSGGVLGALTVSSLCLSDGKREGDNGGGGCDHFEHGYFPFSLFDFGATDK